MPSLLGSNRRVLVVDDYHDGADSLVLMVRAMGAHAEAVYDGESAIKILGAFRPDVVLLDIAMPGLSGHEIARAIRETPGFERVCLIAVSGWGSEADRQKSADSGFDAHLVKPLDLSALESLLVELTSR